MNLLPSYTACIQRIYPNLPIDRAHLNQEGQYNDVLVVNEALIFRFAKVPAALQTLRRETAILRSIRDHITLQIPDPVYHNLETSIIGETFVGYPMIAGKPLWRDLFRTIDDPDVLDTIACQLATFLRELHAIPVEETIPIDLPVEAGLDTWAGMYARIHFYYGTFALQEALFGIETGDQQAFASGMETFV